MHVITNNLRDLNSCVCWKNNKSGHFFEWKAATMEIYIKSHTLECRRCCWLSLFICAQGWKYIYTTHTSSTTPHSTFQPRSFCPAARRAAAPIHFAKSVHNNYFLSRGRARSSNAFCHTGNLIVLMRHSACTGKVSSRRRLSTPMRRPKWFTRAHFH